jgi:hypothetical protein
MGTPEDVAAEKYFTPPEPDRVERWNSHYPPGTEVLLTNDFGEVEKTKTRSEAWLLDSGHPVVKVEGRTGGYLLERIRATNEKGQYLEGGYHAD